MFTQMMTGISLDFVKYVMHVQVAKRLMTKRRANSNRKSSQA